MLLTIIILTHNGNGLTMRCVESVAPLLEKRDDICLIIVDNGSAESIDPIIKEKNFSWAERIKVVTLDKNSGVAAGRNVGLKLANSKYILLLDNDTIVPENAIDDLLDVMETNPEYGLIAPCLVSPQGEIQKSFKPFPGIFEKIKNVIGAKNTASPTHSSHDVLQPFYVIGACQLFRHSVLQKIGFLDEKIFFGPEDADFCMRVRNAGYIVAYIPNVRIVHDWQRVSHRSLLSKTSRKHIAGLFYFYRKWKKLW